MATETLYHRRQLASEEILRECKYTRHFLKITYLPNLQTIITTLVELLNKAETNRKNCLIAKTTATSAGAVGMAMTLGGIIAAPFTAGISIAVVSGIGLGVGIAGAATSVGTSIADSVIEGKDKDEVAKLLQSFKQRDEERMTKFSKLVNIIPNEDQEMLPGLFSFFQGSPKVPCDSRWTDCQVTERDLQVGDHILRRIHGVLYHHGIVLDISGSRVVVIDFGLRRRKTGISQNSENGSSEVAVKYLDDFCDRNKSSLQRRNYNGICLPIQETAQLARLALNRNLPSFQDKYNFFSNNCEHFVTYLKTGIPRSKQTKVFGKVGFGAGITVQTLSNATTGLEAVGISIAKFAAATGSETPRFLSIFTKATKTVPAMSGFSKACLVLGPIGTVLDIGMLVYDFKKEKVNVAMIQSTLGRLKEVQSWISQCKDEIPDYIKMIQERIPRERGEFEKQRHRQRIEKERRDVQIKNIAWTRYLENLCLGLVFTLYYFYSVMVEDVWPSLPEKFKAMLFVILMSTLFNFILFL